MRCLFRRVSASSFRSCYFGMVSNKLSDRVNRHWVLCLLPAHSLCSCYFLPVLSLQGTSSPAGQPGVTLIMTSDFVRYRTRFTPRLDFRVASRALHGRAPNWHQSTLGVGTAASSPPRSAGEGGRHLEVQRGKTREPRATGSSIDR